MKSSKGLTLIEILVALTLIVILFFPMIELLNSSFLAEYNNRMNVEAKEFREIALNRMSSTIKQASYIYPSGTKITIPTENGSYEATVGSNAIAILVPSYDEDGDLIQEDTNTEFDAYTYALVPASNYYSNSSSSDMVLVETYNNFDAATTDAEPTTPSTTPTTDWSGSTAMTNIIFDGAKPGSFESYTSTFSNAEPSQIEIVFGSKNGKIYYPASGTNTTTIPYKNIHSINVFCRNYSF
ncbi:MAG: PilW family protein [Vampirovibrionia bacterium]